MRNKRSGDGSGVSGTTTIPELDDFVLGGVEALDEALEKFNGSTKRSIC